MYDGIKQKRKMTKKDLVYHEIYMRSSWEIAYAKWLDKNGIEWQYESDTFDLDNTTI